MKGVGRNPFRILGVSPSASLETIKKAFTKLALQHHPDTANTRSYKEFIIVRNAYETIRDSINTGDSREGMSNVRRENNWNSQTQEKFSEEEFLEHLYRQTGTKISSAQRRELIKLDLSRMPGATYHGPGWDFARRVAIEQDLFMKRGYESQFSQGGSWEKRSGSKFSSEHKTDSNQSHKKTDTRHDNLRRRRRR
ncbi:unnamed protein product [Pseudo-nitzschia multistriata]|uniref:J domain-containing protein n=1 Tax=Pseudo-nitzschia multistriata TaxID=183589 RepID=A0A448YVP5_9STRA|nr:unnamed protein product [Pseudo-nitzschia multistriata]